MSVKDFLAFKAQKLATNFLFVASFVAIFSVLLETGVLIYQNPNYSLTALQNSPNITKQLVLGAFTSNDANVLSVSEQSPIQTACGQSACLTFTLNEFDRDSKTWGGTISVYLLGNYSMYGKITLNDLPILASSIGTNGVSISVNNLLVSGQTNNIVLYNFLAYNNVPIASLNIAVPAAPSAQNRVTQCLYPAPPAKCSYVPSTGYNSATDCGKVLICETQISSSPQFNQQAIPESSSNQSLGYQFDPTPTVGKNSIIVKASGTDAYGIYPTMELRLGGAVLGSWTVNSQLQNFTVNTNSDITGQNLKVYFINDAYNPPYSDRNLFVDSIIVNGTQYSANSSNVYSEGGWDAAGCSPGYKKVSWLYCNGYFEFPTVSASIQTGQQIISSTPVSKSSGNTQYWLHPGFAQLSTPAGQTDPYLNANNWGDILNKVNVYSFFLEDVANFKRYDRMDNLKQRLSIIGNKQINIEWWSLRTGSNVKTCSPAKDPENAVDIDWNIIPECKVNQATPDCVGKISAVIDVKRMQPIYDLGKKVDYYTMDNPIARVQQNNKAISAGANNYCNFSLDDSIKATVSYMSTVHKTHPEIKFNMYVAFPNSIYNGIPPWAWGAEAYGHDQLDYKNVLASAVSGIQAAGEHLDAIHADSPYNYMVADGSNPYDNRRLYNYMTRLVDLNNQVHSLGLKFGVVFNTDRMPNSTSQSAITAADQNYAQDTYEYIKKFKAAGGSVDNMVVESWYTKNINGVSVETPSKTFPASQENTFLNIAGKAFDLYKSLDK